MTDNSAAGARGKAHEDATRGSRRSKQGPGPTPFLTTPDRLPNPCSARIGTVRMCLTGHGLQATSLTLSTSTDTLHNRSVRREMARGNPHSTVV